MGIIRNRPRDASNYAEEIHKRNNLHPALREYFLEVRALIEKALHEETTLSTQHKEDVEIATILYETVMTTKKDSPGTAFFGELVFAPENYRATMDILRKIKVTEGSRMNILRMMFLIPCVANSGEDGVEHTWMFIPRDCYQLESISERGIRLYYRIATSNSLPEHIAKTPQVTSEDDLAAIATKERFDAYKKSKISVSVIDHFYDKFLHIGRYENLKSNNDAILLYGACYQSSVEMRIIDYWNQFDE